MTSEPAGTSFGNETPHKGLAAACEYINAIRSSEFKCANERRSIKEIAPFFNLGNVYQT